MTPAAVLQVLVNANTSQATAALTKTQTQLKATEAQAGRDSIATAILEGSWGGDDWDGEVA